MDDGVEYDRIVDVSNLQAGEFSAYSFGVEVKGRLRAVVDFWCDTLGASEFGIVLSIIRDGYRLPFADNLSRCFFAQ